MKNKKIKSNKLFFSGITLLSVVLILLSTINGAFAAELNESERNFQEEKNISKAHEFGAIYQEEFERIEESVLSLSSYADVGGMVNTNKPDEVDTKKDNFSDNNFNKEETPPSFKNEAKRSIPPVVYVATDGSGDFNCDGTDDHEEINEAIEFVAMHDDYNTVHLKGGTYIFNDVMNIRSNMIFEGDGEDSTVLKLKNQNNRAKWSFFYGDGITDTTIQHFKVDGNFGGQSGLDQDDNIDAFRIYYSDNIIIQNVTCQRTYTDHFEFYQSSDCTVRYCTSKNSGHESATVVHCDRITVSDNYAENLGNCGVRIYDSNYCIVERNEYYTNDYGILVDTEGSGIYGGNIYRNNYINIEKYGNYEAIRIHSEGNTIIENETFFQNTIEGSDKKGYNMIVSQNGKLRDISIIGDTITGCQDEAIYLEAGQGLEIRGCIIENNDYGIFLDDISQSDNLIYNNYLNNTNNAFDRGNNLWNIQKTLGENILGGRFLGGNFWSDYEGADQDGDGLGDTPYQIPGGSSKDQLPLVQVQPTLKNLIISLNENGTVTLYWDGILEESYDIYIKEDYREEFPIDPNYTINGQLSWTDMNAEGYSQRFYDIGVRGSSRINEPVGKLDYDLYTKPDGTGKNLISFPFETDIETASELMESIGKPPSGNCTVVNRWNPITQESEGLINSGTGNNFDLVPGEGYEVWVNKNTSWTAVGKVLEPETIELNKKQDGTSKNWIGLPLCSPLSDASELMDDIGMTPTGSCTVVNRWNPITQKSEGWLDLRVGTNFNIIPGEGYEVWVKENTSYLPYC